MRRIITATIAIVVSLSICFIVSLAVSTEIREALFAHIGTAKPENSPKAEQADMETGKTQISFGGVIEGTRISCPTQSFAGNGVFMVCTDEIQMNSGNHYAAYYEENGGLISLEEQFFDQNYHILGNDIPLKLQWVEHKGNVSITYVEADAPFYKPDHAGNASSTLMMLQIDPPGDLTYTLYPVLINVQTGELTDICAGLGVENLPEILQAAISQDLKKMVLVDWEKNLYYADLTNKKLYAVDDLLGKEASACVLTNEKLVCWSEEKGSCSVRVFDPATWESQEVYTGQPKFIKGFDHHFVSCGMYLGTRFALEVDADRNVFAIDLTSGVKSPIEGFLWPETGKTECVPSADGNKLLICTRADTACYESVGVLDFLDHTYWSLSRGNSDDISERATYWLDNDRVIIETGSEGDNKDYYVYMLPAE